MQTSHSEALAAAQQKQDELDAAYQEAKTSHEETLASAQAAMTEAADEAAKRDEASKSAHAALTAELSQARLRATNRPKHSVIVTRARRPPKPV